MAKNLCLGMARNAILIKKTTQGNYMATPTRNKQTNQQARANFFPKTISLVSEPAVCKHRTELK